MQKAPQISDLGRHKTKVRKSVSVLRNAASPTTMQEQNTAEIVQCFSRVSPPLGGAALTPTKGDVEVLAAAPSSPRCWLLSGPTRENVHSSPASLFPPFLLSPLSFTFPSPPLPSVPHRKKRIRSCRGSTSRRHRHSKAHFLP